MWQPHEKHLPAEVRAAFFQSPAARRRTRRQKRRRGPTRRPSRDRRQTAMQNRAKAGPGGRLQAPEAEQHAIHPFYRGISPRKAQNPKSFP